ncbi:MAG: hypothetical protein NXI04_13200 [Planctomycetaceae bacterium]|nr:hypothetical protein [Planctomycetaceae bacterium]
MSSENPFGTSSEPNPGLGDLGDLAQSSRQKELGQAKGALIVVGLLTAGVNGFMLANAENEVNGLGLANPQEVLTIVRIIYGGAMLLGIGLITCGCLVKTWPVPMTCTGLGLYLLGTAGFAVLNPMSLVQGIIFKVIIIVVLAKSVKTAFAYQADRKAGLV